MQSFLRRTWQSFVSVTGVSVITFLAYRLIPLNSTTVGFAYLLFVLIVASTWGFLEASVASLFAALLFNFFFFEPIGTLVIDDPQNWAAVFSLFGTALIGSRLSAIAKRRAFDAMERQQDLERLYTFSRAILLIDATEPFPKQLARKLADVFDLSAVLLYDRRSDEVYRAGPSDFEGMEDQLREAALQGTSFTDTKRSRVITAVRLGAEPIASLALQGETMPDSVLQGIANLIAIGLERARAQELGHQIEAARQTERLRTTLIDAMAHELKTPLTSIKAATTALLANPEQPEDSRSVLLKIADEEAERLKELIDDALEIARLDAEEIDIQAEICDLREIAGGVVVSMQTVIDSRPVEVAGDPNVPPIPLDRRLIKLALKQLLDNALKYSPPGTPVMLNVRGGIGVVYLEITDRGSGIPVQEQRRVFERFYRSPSAQNAIPGFGLGLSIARRIVQAHHGELAVESQPGETTFRITLPINRNGEPR